MIFVKILLSCLRNFQVKFFQGGKKLDEWKIFFQLIIYQHRNLRKKKLNILLKNLKIFRKCNVMKKFEIFFEIVLMVSDKYTISKMEGSSSTFRNFFLCVTNFPNMWFYNFYVWNFSTCTKQGMLRNFFLKWKVGKLFLYLKYWRNNFPRKN